MKRAYIVVEGETDADFLRKVLPAESQRDVELVVANGKAYIPSMARSLIVRRRIPVAVFMDADSLNPSVIGEFQGSTEELIQAAAGSVPVKVILAVPTLETYFFVAPEVIERVLGEKVPDDWIYFGQRDPVGVLTQLEARAKRKWDTSQAIKELNPQDIERLRKARPIHELIEFLENLQITEAAGSK